VVRKSYLSGWGRTFLPGREVRSEDLEHITRRATLSRGLGRSYGDASLPATAVREVVGTTLADRVLGFDEATGLLRAEAGFSLRELYRLFLPRGFFTPVTPGTKFVTLGGMVAADVHGKNHHVDGTIGRHVQSLRLRVADGRVVTCSRDEEPELFFATLGGMGLTGHILEVELRLARVPSPYIHQETFRIPDLDTYLSALKVASQRWPFTVGWIDTLARGKALGRGLLFCGRWAEPHEAPRGFPSPKLRVTMPALPSGVLNRATIGLFNEAVYRQHLSLHRVAVVDADTFFYPLDRVQHWNRGYGKRGVTQHQCVIPTAAVADGIRAMIEILSRLEASSFLTVIKDCGPEGEGLLSFPRPGVSLALDIPIRDNVQEVIDALNERVIACGGRIYLAKDGFTRPEHYAAMDPRLPRFLAIRDKWDPQRRIRSAQSERLFGDKP
jgi:decaprenylphospho-beta-D-ribofuranose 2-oxidase